MLLTGYPIVAPPKPPGHLVRWLAAVSAVCMLASEFITASVTGHRWWDTTAYTASDITTDLGRFAWLVPVGALTVYTAKRSAHMRGMLGAAFAIWLGGMAGRSTAFLLIDPLGIGTPIPAWVAWRDWTSLAGWHALVSLGLALAARTGLGLLREYVVQTGGLCGRCGYELSSMTPGDPCAECGRAEPVATDRGGRPWRGHDRVRRRRSPGRSRRAR
ncbi:MAG: hypothetical protein AAFQ71_00680 [Planctomycetota bacterium]